ncbi:MAG: GNAT family N-acetyltransferase [Clostridia bacterium]|nr:GNAT family N-acetyltransferase [Clostridia bacterium]
METERLILDRFRDSDRDGYYRCIAHDRKVLETFMCRYAESPDEVDTAPLAADERVFAVRLKETGRLIGMILWFGEDGGSCEMGYALGSEYWGRGFATEAASEFLRYLFLDKGFGRVCASHFTGNEASGRVMEKCGMRYIRTSEKELTYLGIPRDLVWYSADRDGWMRSVGQPQETDLRVGH